MKFGIFCALFVAAFADEATEIRDEENVLVLTAKNFNNALINYEFVLVEFYSPWCGLCIALAPEYAKAAGSLKKEKSKIKLAKIDVTVEVDLARKFKIWHYPTFRLFSNGSDAPVEYTGGRDEAGFISWLKKKTGPPAVELKSVDDATTHQEKHDVFVVGFFKDQSSAEAKAFLQTATELDNIEYGITSNDGVFKQHKVDKDGVVLFKKFDEGRNDYDGDLKSSDDLKKFIKGNQLPSIIELTPKTVDKIFGGDIRKHVFLFLSKEANSTKTILEDYKTTSKKFKGKSLFVYLDIDSEDHARIMESFGLKDMEVPAVRMIFLQDKMTKYKPKTTEITVDALKKFVQSVLDGKLKSSDGEDERPKKSRTRMP